MAGNAQVVRDAYATFSRGDIPALVGSFSEDIDWEVTSVLPQGGTFHGRDGAGQFFQRVGELWEDLSVEVSELLDAGDQVVAIGHIRGTRRGQGPADYAFVHVWTLADRTPVRFREFADPRSGF
jgi:ketosteroid isomerase-like protein